jgi:hypothetical protein
MRHIAADFFDYNFRVTSLLRTIVLSAFVVLTVAWFAGCRSTSRSGDGGSILGPADETSEAGDLVKSANEDLTKIKVLYEENEGKREDLKKAMSADDAAAVRKISDEVVYLINDGTGFGTSAIDKIDRAQEMNINDDYKEYLRLKGEALRKQLEAFENYRQAARALRDNYDPKNTQLRDKVKEEFKTRSENYQRIMEKARDLSAQANELAKEVRQREQRQ